MGQAFSGASIAAMSFNMILGIGLPVLLIALIKKKYKMRLGIVFIGASAYIVSDMLFLTLINTLILNITPLADFFQANRAVYYFAYGVLHGAIQVGDYYLMIRFLMKDFLRKENALMFGVGVRVIDSVMAYGVNSGLSLLMVATSVNGQGLDAYLEGFGTEYMEENRAILENMIGTPASQILGVGLAGAFLFFLSIAVSVLVFLAAKRAAKKYLFAPAFLICMLDGLLLELYNGGAIDNILIYMAFLGLLAVVSCVPAFFVYRADQEQERGRADIITEKPEKAEVSTTSMRDKIARVNQISGREDKSKK